jgi:hypothetical protein
VEPAGPRPTGRTALFAVLASRSAAGSRRAVEESLALAAPVPIWTTVEPRHPAGGRGPASALQALVRSTGAAVLLPAEFE